MTATLITLIRHGQTTWNADGRWQGHADVPLSPVGEQQAQELAARLVADSAVRFDRVYTSDLQRAAHTAAAVAAALGVPLHPLPALREVHLGTWSGLTSAEIRARYGDAALDHSFAGRRGEHGETEAEFSGRITAALTEIAAQHPGEHIAVVSHGGSIRAALQYLVDTRFESGHHIKNTSLTTLRYQDGQWSLERLNDHAHLGTVAPSTATL